MAEGMAEVYGYMNREKNQKNKNKKKEFEIWLYSRTSEQRTLWEWVFCPFFGGCPYLEGSPYFDILCIYIISKMFQMGR